jgi:hypothetical protein
MMARCSAKTKAGARCKVSAMNGKSVCIFHRDAGDMRAKRMYARLEKSYRRRN